MALETHSYAYHHHQYGTKVWATRDEWLAAILTGNNSPKPPEWWLAAQEREFGQARNRKTASIIWGRAYKADRKFTIWSQAPDEDFRFLGYL